VAIGGKRREKRSTSQRLPTTIANLSDWILELVSELSESHGPLVYGISRRPRSGSFYALQVIANAPPRDSSYAEQKKAGAILEKIFAELPNHPGMAHYIIHAYDNPMLANRALAAARSYAKIAPSSVHALHMPSHIFIQVGSWQEAIASNLASLAAARAWVARSRRKELWDQQAHAQDYSPMPTCKLDRISLQETFAMKLAATLTGSEKPPGQRTRRSWDSCSLRIGAASVV